MVACDGGLLMFGGWRGLPSASQFESRLPVAVPAFPIAFGAGKFPGWPV